MKRVTNLIMRYPTATLVLVGVFILGHEVIKEGYLFQVSDIFVPRMTHEKTLLMLAGGGLFVRHRRKVNAMGY